MSDDEHRQAGTAAQCACASYNNPERISAVNPTPEVILTPPFDLGDGRTTVCVDACIAQAVADLWAHGFVTLNSCCGHGSTRPSLIVGPHEDVAAVRSHLTKTDGREWDLSQRRLVMNPDRTPAP